MRYFFAKKTILVLAFVACCNGCALMKKEDQAKSKEKSWFSSTFFKKEYQTPSTMAAIWSPDILTMTGKPPTRGFGGRVYLYNAKSQAVPVDGELIVHGYNRKDRKNDETIEADKTFRFTADQLTEHFSPSELGASYSIWIPWDAADGLRQEITLIPSFKDKTGAIVQGAPAKLFLPGRASNPNDQAEELPAPMQTVSYRQSSMPTNSGVELPKFDKLRAIEKESQVTDITVPRGSSITRPHTTQVMPQQRDAFTLGRNASGVEAQLPVNQLPNNLMPNANAFEVQRPLPSGSTTDSMSTTSDQQVDAASEAKVANDPKARARQLAEALRRTAASNGLNNVQALPASYGDVQLTPSKAIEMRPPNQDLHLKSPFAHKPYSMFK